MVNRGLLLLILFYLPVLSTSSVVYVTPTPPIPCHGNPCYNLSYYAKEAEKYLTSNTTMVFLPGEHILEETISIHDVHNFSMVAEDEGSCVIVCSGPDCDGFYFVSVELLQINGLKFVSDNNSVSVQLVKACILTNCTFADSSDTALLAVNSSLWLDGNMFVNNSGRSQIPNQISPGGGVAVVISNITLQGRNNFTNNTCLDDYCGGSAIYAVKSTIIVEGNVSVVNNTVMNNIDTGVPSGGAGFLFFDSTVEISGHVELLDNSVSNKFTKGSTCEIGGGGASFILCNTKISGKVILSNNLANGISGCGGGLFLPGGSLTISGTVQFSNNHAGYQGGGLFIKKATATVDVLGTVVFSSNSADQSGGGGQIEYSIVNIEGDALFISNHAGPYYSDVIEGGGCDMWYSSLNVKGTLSFSSNSAFQGGGLAVINSNMSSSGNLTINHNMDGNVYEASGGGILIRGSSNIIWSNALVANNSGYEGGGMAVQGGNMIITESVTFMYNSALYQGGGAVFIDATLNNSGTLEFIENSAVESGGLIMASSKLIVAGILLLRENYANTVVDSDAGGMYLRNNSIVTVLGTMTLVNNTASHSGGGMIVETSRLDIAGKVYFTENRAGLGGAIYVSDTNELVYCSSKIEGAECVKDNCFFRNISTNGDTLMVFEDNEAQSGSVLFGGSVDSCRLDNQPDANSGEIFDSISDFSKQPKTDSMFSSNPYSVCLCENNTLNCGKVGAITAYPGETFSFDAVTIGQRNGTVILEIINAVANPPDVARLGVFEDRQHTVGCTRVNYTLFSNIKQNQLELYVLGSCSSLYGSKTRLQIPVDLTFPCPSAFTLSKPPYRCICEERLQKFTNSCDINGQTILRNGDFWVGYDNNSESDKLILHPHCPFDYCKAKHVNFTLNEIDLQCNHNRTGLLCGACKPGLSLAIGNSKCLPCSNAYLSLLVPFALMGLALILFLLIFQLFTVKAGVISGLIFYASIVGANQKIFFPPGKKNVLSIYVISWFRLDLGYQTCFYDGMDIYVKTWLQFVFPIYIFSLILIFILIKKRFPSITKWAYFLRKDHPNAVLCTLFILSYGKIVRTVISVFSYTTLLYPNNKTELVWLYDANIKYLQGKHISLFVVSVIFAVTLILPFTLLLLFGGLHKLLPERFSWIKTNLAKVLALFHKPYNERHCYWPGLLLVVRLALFIIFGVNALRDYSENLLAISASVFGLLAWPWLIIGQVYKPEYRWFGVLESTYLLNLGVFAGATFYVQQSGGDQATLAYISTGIALASFLGTLLYHIYDQRKYIKKVLRWLFISSRCSIKDNNARDGESNSLIKSITINETYTDNA